MKNENKIRNCFGYSKEPAYRLHGLEVCSATHPKQPNHSGHSRGRKMHLAKNETHTICNMLIDEYVPESNQLWSIVANGKCGNCFNQASINKVKSS